MCKELEQILSAGKPYIGVVQGKSMLPFLRDAIDHVDIRPIKKKIKKFDIILYKRDNGQYVLHRLIQCHNQTYVMRGDNQYKKEFGIQPEMCLGILYGYWKNTGTCKERYVSVSDISYKTLSFLWLSSYPIRFFVRYIRTICNIIFQKIKRRHQL